MGLLLSQPPLRPARDIDEFMHSPVGRYFTGSGFIVWTYSPTLLGNIYLGRLTSEDLGQVMRMFPLPGHPSLEPPFDVVMDGSLLCALELPVYETLSAYVSTYLQLYLPLVRRIAILRPQGLVGVIIAGLFHDLLQGKIDAGLFDEPAAAFRFLGRPNGEAAAAAVEALKARAHGVPAVVRQLRGFLAGHLNERDLSLTKAASALGISARSLQRQLQASQTSFRDEMIKARIDAAQLLLTQSQDKLEEIARRVGFGSLSHFSSLFQGRTGQPPSRFRVGQRR